ncbi:YaiI/YqxD family protein [Shewanella sp. GXUN23E]|uniref:YaiI/YqxD family protein n=1 Tax=Shewanella sp. GXUN23E TaxID=3422498 RepID=UPI003D7C772A
MVTIWVDADACPNPVKEILFKAAERLQVPLKLVANHSIRVPPSRFISCVRVEQGFDVADNYLVAQLQANDLVISSDIPLAADALKKGAYVVTPRGEPMTRENIGERLNMRDFFDTLRGSGIQTGGPAALSNQDKHAFSRQLDIWSRQVAKLLD